MHTQTGPYSTVSKPSTVAGSLDLWSAWVSEDRLHGVEDAGLASGLLKENQPDGKGARGQSCSTRDLVTTTASLRSS